MANEGRERKAPPKKPKVGLQAHHEHRLAQIDGVVNGIDEVLKTNEELVGHSDIQKGGE